MKLKFNKFISICILVLLIGNIGHADRDSFYSNINRISGEDRYSTAATLSKSNYEKSDTVILVSGEAFADAISSSQLARSIKCPILLTKQSSMPKETLDEINRLRAKKIIVVGGHETINEEQFNNFNIDVERISGEDRYETSEKILLKMEIKHPFDSQIVLVSGEQFQNIVSANQIAISKEIPMLLVKDKLPLRYYDRQFYQVGELNIRVNPLERISGVNNYDVSANCLAKHNNPNLKLTICNGENFTDAILAASQQTNVLLTNKNYVNPYAVDFLKVESFSKIQIIGGAESVDDSVIHQLYGIDDKNVKAAKLPEKMNPNHDGDIMVLMYHDLDYYNDLYHRTEGAIKADIINLYNRGYLPISIEEYFDNKINIKEGYTPYVLTFDDGTDSKIVLNNDGSLNKICVVSVLKELERELPHFKSKATIFVNNKYPFGQVKFISQKLDMIIKSGMIVGNHTLNHTNLCKHPDKIEEEIAVQKQNLESYITSNYNINIFSLPYSTDLCKSEHERVKHGEYNGIQYENRIILGGTPDPTLAPGKFNPDNYIIPRISVPGSAEGRTFYDYLSFYDKHPEKRYVK